MRATPSLHASSSSLPSCSMSATSSSVHFDFFLSRLSNSSPALWASSSEECLLSPPVSPPSTRLVFLLGSFASPSALSLPWVSSVSVAPTPHKLRAAKRPSRPPRGHGRAPLSFSPPSGESEDREEANPDECFLFNTPESRRIPETTRTPRGLSTRSDYSL
ncbi:hypothetical protein TGP89_418380 [Toxoplasma gondii p89]|uniref:Uncharacterized protein n=1 Tax=Toxoplasma gondii p89 TaxID=943119 RepID=A0A086L568_TOXGO|nr:hypothetical protein TGP89_418380 [Toxoplasma gondii p89]